MALLWPHCGPDLAKKDRSAQVPSFYAMWARSSFHMWANNMLLYGQEHNITFFLFFSNTKLYTLKECCVKYNPVLGKIWTNLTKLKRLSCFVLGYWPEGWVKHLKN